MGKTAHEYFEQLLFYFLQLPLFSLKLSIMSFATLDDIIKICPERPKPHHYKDTISTACKKYPFLEKYAPERLAALFNLVSTVREADTFLYPFLTRRNIGSFNNFYGIDTLADSYKSGPVLVLYSHTGSYYQIASATGVAGYNTYPIAYTIDLASIEKPFRWLYLLNMKLSKRNFSDGHYLYTNTPAFARTLKTILSDSRQSLIYAALDIPREFITEKRLEVNFIGNKTAFPYQIIDIFNKRRLPIFTAFPFIEIRAKKLRRSVSFEKVPGEISTHDILQLYATRLENFIYENPEQLITLGNLGDFFV